MDVVDLFGLKGVQHTPISIKNARVSQVIFLCSFVSVTKNSKHVNNGTYIPFVSALQSQLDC